MHAVHTTAGHRFLRYIIYSSTLFRHWNTKYHSGVKTTLYVHMDVSIYPCLYDSLSSLSHRFLIIVRADRNYALRMWLQATSSYILNGSIIGLPICQSGCLWDFCKFCIFISLYSLGPVSQCIYSQTGFQGTIVGSSQVYIPVHLSLCISVTFSIFPVFFVSIWQSFAISITVCSACVCRTRGKIP